MTDSEIRIQLILAGIKNLTEYGYKNVDKKNILTDYIFTGFFISMLESEENTGLSQQIERVRLKLIDEVKTKRQPA